MSISARVDYAVQALCTLADSDRTMTARQLSVSLGLPHKFLEAVLTELQRGEILTSRRGVAGGYGLARPADEISLHEVIRSLVGALAEVRGHLPEAIAYRGSAEHLRAAWLAVRSSLRLTLDGITIADIVTGDLSHDADSSEASGATLAPEVNGARVNGSGSPSLTLRDGSLGVADDS